MFTKSMRRNLSFRRISQTGYVLRSFGICITRSIKKILRARSIGVTTRADLSGPRVRDGRVTSKPRYGIAKPFIDTSPSAINVDLRALLTFVWHYVIVSLCHKSLIPLLLPYTQPRRTVLPWLFYSRDFSYVRRLAYTRLYLLSLKEACCNIS